MRAAHVVSVRTPQNIVLDGLWYGGTKARTGFIFLHGLTSTAFAQQELLTTVANTDTAVLAISNRGHDKITGVKRLNADIPKGYEYIDAGEAHEVFTECVDDIQGAVNFMREQGVESIYLLGHSTGCQKSVFYLSRSTKDACVKGAVLVCAVSDYAYTVKTEDPVKLQKAVEHARRLVAEGRPHELLPLDVWPDLYDAQRFLSLNTPDSEEEIFSYSQPQKQPTTLKQVTDPLLVIYAGADEYLDRPVAEAVRWFEEATTGKPVVIKIVEGASHNLEGARKQVVGLISEWLPVA
jgi:alpha-beta hydrolase superfamily lysophospholipase